MSLIYFTILNGGFMAVSLQLLYNAFRSFHAGLYMLDRVITMHILEFIIQFQFVLIC